MSKSPDTIILEELTERVDDLFYFCSENGIVPEHRNLTSIMEALKKFTILNPKICYYNVNIDKFGYIERISPIETLIDFQHPTPMDVEDGYYILKGNEYVSDPFRKDVLYPDRDAF